MVIGAIVARASIVKSQSVSASAMPHGGTLNLALLSLWARGWSIVFDSTPTVT
jgi:hypothetical protein